MKAVIEIVALETIGDQISVKARGHTAQSAEWRRPLVWSFNVPEWIGKQYKIGQVLQISVS